MANFLIPDTSKKSCDGQKSNKVFFSRQRNKRCGVSGKKIVNMTNHHYFWPEKTLDCLEETKIIKPNFKQKIRLVTFKLCGTCHNDNKGFHNFFFDSRCDENLYCQSDCTYERICCYHPLKITAQKHAKIPDFKIVFKNKEFLSDYLEEAKEHLAEWGAIDQAIKIESIIKEYT